MLFRLALREYTIVIMKNALFLGQIIVLSICPVSSGTFNDGTQASPFILQRKNSVVPSANIPLSLRDQYYTIYNGSRTGGKKWRVGGLIEHRHVVEVIEHTVSFHFDEVIMETSPKYSLNGLSSISFTNTNGFTKTNSVSTSYQITVSGERTLSVGVNVSGATLSNSLASQLSFSYGLTTSYSESYSSSLSTTVTYNISDLQNVPSGGTIGGCLVGDFFEATARIKEEEYWWWGTYDTVAWQTFTFRVYTYTYNTYIFSNGTFGSAPDRNY